MRMAECGPLDQIFSHEDLDGVVRHFNASAMLRGVVREVVPATFYRITLEEELIDHLVSNHGIEEHHLDRALDLEEPVLMVEFSDGKSLVIDGNHRLVKRWRLGKKVASAAVVAPGNWEKFLVVDLAIPRELYAGHV